MPVCYCFGRWPRAAGRLLAIFVLALAAVVGDCRYAGIQRSGGSALDCLRCASEWRARATAAGARACGRHRAQPDHDRLEVGDRAGLLARRKEHRVRAARLGDLPDERRRLGPAPAHVRSPRRLPRLVARRQEDRVPAAVQERLAPLRHVRDGRGPATAAAGAARGAAVLDAEQQVDPDPVGRRPRSGRRPDRDDPAVLRPDHGHPDLAERHRLAERPDDRVPRAAAQHRPGGLRGGAVPAVRRSIWLAFLRPTARGGSSTTPAPQAGRPTGRR